MRLSEAINLGRHLIEKPNPQTYCRCAIGMGLAAIGNHFHEEKHNVGVLHHAIAKWPWLETEMAVPVDLLPYHNANKTEAFLVVSILFFAVERQELRLEQLIDWVRSVEPEELHPEQKAVELIPVAAGAHTREEGR